MSRWRAASSGGGTVPTRAGVGGVDRVGGGGGSVLEREGTGGGALDGGAEDGGRDVDRNGGSDLDSVSSLGSVRCGTRGGPGIRGGTIRVRPVLGGGMLEDGGTDDRPIVVARAEALRPATPCPALSARSFISPPLPPRRIGGALGLPVSTRRT